TKILGQITPPLPVPSLPIEPKVIDRGAHYKTYEATILLTNQLTGEILSHVSHYTELGNGLSFLDDSGHWQESNPQFILIGGSAIATQTLSKVILSPDLDTAGSFDLLAPDGKRLRGNITALGLYDAKTGQAILFATLKP